MRRLYVQIYLTVVGVLAIFALLGSLVWWISRPERQVEPFMRGLAEVLETQLAPPGAAPAEAEQSLSLLNQRLGVHTSLYSASGTLVASIGELLPLPPQRRRVTGWVRGHLGPPAALFVLPDGRQLMARPEGRARTHRNGWLLLLVFGAALALGSRPVVRRLTRRLERLRASVEELGAGDLRARVEVEGRDEVADLARSFNRAADRIERLVSAQKTALASASHELRSPLARMRVAVELMGEERPELRERIAKDIAELDELIGELLLASRIETVEELAAGAEVDLLALAAEEAARVGAAVRGAHASVRGEPRLLRRMLRNLLENARRHAAGSPIEVDVDALGAASARIQVCDRGPGVPEAERERIFEPFYRPAGMRESGEGVGLGLALVRQIARHHGGDAVCLAREGGGSRFVVELASADVAEAGDEAAR